MKNLYKEFLKVADKYPDRKCITDNNLSFTYKEIKSKVESAILLIKASPNTCGIIYLPKSIDLIVWQIAMNAKSIAFLTLEWGQENRKKSSIKKCAPSFIISINNNRLEITNFNYFKIYPAECAYIIFSSGSSGEPKKSC